MKYLSQEVSRIAFSPCLQGTDGCHPARSPGLELLPDLELERLLSHSPAWQWETEQLGKASQAVPAGWVCCTNTIETAPLFKSHSAACWYLTVSIARSPRGATDLPQPGCSKTGRAQTIIHSDFNQKRKAHCWNRCWAFCSVCLRSVSLTFYMKEWVQVKNKLFVKDGSVALKNKLHWLNTTITSYFSPFPYE